MPDPDRFIHEFSGSNRALTEYLIEEVLGQQPEEVRRFLLDTCILEQFDLELCTAVTGRPDAAALLEQVEADHLFIVALDDGRTRRYHDLFAELLRHQLRTIDPERERTLHRAAAGALATRGAIDRAIHHHLAAGDDDAVLELLTNRVEQAYFADDGLTIQRCLSELESVWIIGSAARQVEFGFVLGMVGRLDEAKRHLDAAGPAAGAAGDPLLLGRYEVVASLLAGVRGDGASTLAHASRAQELAEIAGLPSATRLPAFTLRAELWHGAFRSGLADLCPRQAGAVS